MHRLRPTLLWLLLVLAPLAALADDLRYDVEIAGHVDRKVKSDLETISELFKLKDRPPPSEAGLRRRAEGDLERMKRVAESAGYWAAQIEYSIDLEAQPAKVTVRVEQGPLYYYQAVTLISPAGDIPALVGGTPPKDLGLELGSPARSAPVLEAEPKIVDRLAQQGHPFGKVVERKVVVDHGTRTMSITYVVDNGPPARFGPTEIDGLKTVKRSFVEHRIAMVRGEPFDSRKVEVTRKALIDSGLFGTVRIDHAAAPDASGEAANTIHLSERLPRTVGGGLNYNTSEGFGAKATWEHRNLFGGGERLRFSADLAQDRLGGVLAYRQPDLFARKEDDFVASAELANDTPVAYSSRHERLYMGIEHRLETLKLPKLVLGVGMQLEQGTATEEERQITQTYTLFGAPLTARYDTTDDLLNPTEGYRAQFSMTPSHGIAGRSLDFVFLRLVGSAYQGLDADNDYVLAGFAALGSVYGEARDTLPADKRLYAGGGGSLRGYGYQLAGPLGPNRKPLGGSSSLELSGEIRIKITETIGIVPFVDIGNVYDRSTPDLGSSLLYDAGIGLRYYTPVGPIRLDVATPLRRRDGDSPFQLYISIGQAF